MVGVPRSTGCRACLQRRVKVGAPRPFFEKKKKKILCQQVHQDELTTRTKNREFIQGLKITPLWLFGTKQCRTV
ncbi:hypothetical protein BDV28DRAFT_120809 [Aspergillus coremiiformis]|uniref:Uncharacterized protein n=1 Tax=Aspergillus coremiiformis TaxID=138285 RepID=A0A5N6Z4Y4_9EURO|nr:hypothetical protein BDV28DRAFT_120809 [Aspergillus coremiiformis]